jgi:hypothetical protein
VKAVLPLRAFEPNFVLPSLPWQEAQLVAKAADKVPEVVVVVGVVGDAGAGEEPLDELQPVAVSTPTTALLKINERINKAYIGSAPLRWFT